MYADVVRAEPLNDFLLRVELDNGRKGIFDLKPYLSYPAYWKLQNPGYFRCVRVEHGVLCWPNDEDVAPENVEAELKES